MRRCRSWYRMRELLYSRLPLPPGPLADSLALWLQGTLLAGNGCLDRVATALAAGGGKCPHAAPPAVRRAEGRCGAAGGLGADQELDVETCFAPLRAWVLSWMVPPGAEALPPPLVMAVDPTHQADRLVDAALAAAPARPLRAAGRPRPVPGSLTHSLGPPSVATARCTPAVRTAGGRRRPPISGAAHITCQYPSPPSSVAVQFVSSLLVVLPTVSRSACSCGLGP